MKGECFYITSPLYLIGLINIGFYISYFVMLCMIGIIRCCCSWCFLDYSIPEMRNINMMINNVISENRIKDVTYEDIKKFSTRNIENSCPICMLDYNNSDIIIITHCLHYYHKKCLDFWIKNGHNFCPLCRTLI